MAGLLWVLIAFHGPIFGVARRDRAWRKAGFADR
jgi:hypothetical protein